MPVLLYAGLIFQLSSVTPHRSLAQPFPGWDKVCHFLEYLLLSLLLARALQTGAVSHPKSRYLLAFGISFLYGVSDEFHQYFVPNREASGFDLLADLSGSAAGIPISRWIRREKTTSQ